MRWKLALSVVLLLLLTAAAPHAHAGSLGTHGCLACVAASGEEPTIAAPDVTPRSFVAGLILLEVTAPPVTGAPLGAVPGQSPPAS